MTNEELRTLVRATIRTVEGGGPEGIKEVVAPVRAALAERGLGPGCRVGKGLTLTPDEVVEWYAGQLLDIVDKKSWFAMNSLINCVDKFCPEAPPNPAP